MSTEPSPPPDPTRPPTLTIRPWPDPVIDRVGHDLRSIYVERFWLPVLGPSCTLLLRQLAQRFEAEPEGFELDVAGCARSLGLGGGLGRQAPLGRAITRCSQFGATQRFGTAGVVVRRRLPTMARHQLARLPESLQAEHARLVGLAGPLDATDRREPALAAPMPRQASSASLAPLASLAARRRQPAAGAAPPLTLPHPPPAARPATSPVTRPAADWALGDDAA